MSDDDVHAVASGEPFLDQWISVFGPGDVTWDSASCFVHADTQLNAHAGAFAAPDALPQISPNWPNLVFVRTTSKGPIRDQLSLVVVPVQVAVPDLNKLTTVVPDPIREDTYIRVSLGMLATRVGEDDAASWFRNLSCQVEDGECSRLNAAAIRDDLKVPSPWNRASLCRGQR